MVYLARKYLKFTRSQQAIVALTIALSTALITAICLLSFSMQQMAVREAEKTVGKHHVIFNKVDEQQLQALKSDNKILSAIDVRALTTNLIIENDSLQGAFPSYQYVEDISALNHQLIEGEMPKSSDEVVVDEWILEKLASSADVGGNIVLQAVLIGKENERIPLSIKLRVSGVMDTGTNRSSNVALFLLDKSFFEQFSTVAKIETGAICILSSTWDIDKQANAIAQKYSIDENAIRVNQILSVALGGDLQTMIIFGIFLVFVVIVTSSVIYGIYQSMLNNRIQQIGLISCLGATKKQVRIMVLFEGLLSGGLGIPVGLLLGIGFAYLGKGIVANEQFVVSISWFPFVLAVLVSFVTLIVSMRKPERILSSIFPMAAISYNEFGKSNSLPQKRKIKQSSSYRAKETFSLLLAGLKSKRKQLFRSTIGVALGCALLILAFNVVYSINVKGLVQRYFRSDGQITSTFIGGEWIYNEPPTNPIDSLFIDEVKNINGVDRVESQMFAWAFMNNSLEMSKLRGVDIDEKLLSCTLTTVDDSAFNDQLKYVTRGINVDEFKTGNGILLISPEGPDVSPYKIGDTISLLRYDSVNEQYISFAAKVIGFATESVSPFSVGSAGYDVLCSESFLLKNGYSQKTSQLSVFLQEELSDSNRKLVEEEISSFATSSQYVSYRSFSEQLMKATIQTKQASNSVLFILFIIAIICLVNLLSFTIINLLERKKELSLLMIAGMSRNELIKLNVKENIIIGGIAAGIGIIMGNLLGWLAVSAMHNSLSFIQYQFPIVPSFIVLLAVILLQTITGIITLFNMVSKG